jgi:hypothetical protein
MERSSLRRLYFWLTVAGLLVPGYATWRFSMETLAGMGGFSFAGLMMLSPLFYQSAFSHIVATQLLLDVIVTSIAFFLWMFPEGRRLGMRHLWIYPVLTYGLAFSLALPLFLYNREGALEKRRVPLARPAGVSP